MRFLSKIAVLCNCCFIAAVVLRYYENAHNGGSNTKCGGANFTIWGSNASSAFNELTYATDTKWTQLT